MIIKFSSHTKQAFKILSKNQLYLRNSRLFTSQQNQLPDSQSTQITTPSQQDTNQEISPFQDQVQLAEKIINENKELKELFDKYIELQKKPESEFGPGRDPYSTFPEEVKSLLHQTLKPVDPIVERQRTLQLIEEAKLKAPRLKIPEDLDGKIVKSKEEIKNDKDLVWQNFPGSDILDQTGMSLEQLRKFQDKHYEVDIKYEQTRDLYEKQRVQDEFLQQHQEDNKMLNTYYDNTYFKARINNFQNILYYNTYEPKELRFNYIVNVGSCVFATGILAAINPWLVFLMTYDYFLLFGYSKVLNQTCFLVRLDHSKRGLLLDRFNIWGYYREPVQQKSYLRSVKYLGEYTNNYVNLENKGLLPSLAKLFNFIKSKTQKSKSEEDFDISSKTGRKLKQEDQKKKEEELKKEQRSKEKNNFKYFWRFVANNETFMIPIDSSEFEQSCLDKDLLFDAINGRQRRILDFDYTSVEEKMKAFTTLMEQMTVESQRQRGDLVVTEEQRKKRAYQYFNPNREFEGKYESTKLKKVDDGTFVDNGYR